MWITKEYMKKKGNCFGALYSVFNRLKSGFSWEDFGSLLIDNSCLLPRFLYLRYFLLAYHVPCHMPSVLIICLLMIYNW